MAAPSSLLEAVERCSRAQHVRRSLSAWSSYVPDTDRLTTAWPCQEQLFSKSGPIYGEGLMNKQISVNDRIAILLGLPSRKREHLPTPPGRSAKWCPAPHTPDRRPWWTTGPTQAGRKRPAAIAPHRFCGPISAHTRPCAGTALQPGPRKPKWARNANRRSSADPRPA